MEWLAHTISEQGAGLSLLGSGILSLASCLVLPPEVFLGTF